MPNNVVAFIPARLASTRLPRKVLLAETGKPLIQHVYEATRACTAIDTVVVATDADEVAAVVRGFGGTVVMTSQACTCGTERVAEAARQFLDAKIVLNVQGDEPEMSPTPLTALVRGMLARPEAKMGTVATPWPADVPLADPGCVKVVMDAMGDALYFSRSPIPYYRDAPDAAPGTRLPSGAPRHLKHLGLYAYVPAFLQEFTRLPPSPLERAESLEQLRALEHGHRIAVFVSEYTGHEVNTPEDYAAFVRRFRGRARS